MTKKNRNAYIGMNNELLVKNSIGDHPSVISKLKEIFGIKGDFEVPTRVGVYSDKEDVRINFTCGHHIEANVKSFGAVAFNQVTRTSVSRFCEVFGLSSADQKELADIVVAKARNTRNYLFSAEQWVKWGKIFREKKTQLLKWGFSEHPSREILVLYSRVESKVWIYAMKDVLRKLDQDITLTKGGFNIGTCISFQRKGGDNSPKVTVPRTSIKHPGNDIQLKMKPGKFIVEMKDILLASYTI